MIEDFVYALLATKSYWDIRQERNRAPLPEGWRVLQTFDRPGSGAGATWTTSGFSARVYEGPGGEIVIAEGTQFGGSTAGQVADWLRGNAPLALGVYGEQVYQAALLYQEVKKWAAENDRSPGNISFTEDSLGGGPAGLMAAWFARRANVLAPSPVEISAVAGVPA